MLMKRVVSSFIPSLGFSSLSASMVKSGDVLKQARIFSSSDVLEYSKLSHDLNPLHFDIESAQNAGFEDRLVHGMLVASLFPRIIASHFVQRTEIEVSLNSFRSEKQYQHRILWKMLMKRVVSSFIPSLGFSSLSASMVKSGDVLKQARIFSSSNVLEYSKLSHDLNPLHFDIESAQNAGFEDRLVHGMLIASLFPRIIASHFPGAVYVSQSLQFRSPVYIGEEVIGEVQATNIREIKNKYIAKFKTKCFKHGDHLVVEGEATAILPTLAMEQGQSTG